MRRKNKKPLICFIGSSGSGKTTHAVNLCKELKAKAFNCTYMHIAGYALANYIPSMLYKYLKRILTVFKPTEKSFESSNPYSSNESPRSAKLWLLIALINSLPSIVKIKILEDKSVVICDRYFYDYLAIAYNWLFSVYNDWLCRIYLHLIPRPDLIFFLDIPAKIASKRGRGYHLSLYDREREWYLELIKRQNLENLIVIKTDTNLKKVSSSIFDYAIRALSYPKSLNGVKNVMEGVFHD